MTPPGNGPVLKPTREPMEKPEPRPKAPPAPPPAPTPPRLPDPRPPAPPPVEAPGDRGPVLKPRPGGPEPVEPPPAVKLTGPIAQRWRAEGGESWALPWGGITTFTGGAYARFVHPGRPQRFSLILWRPERGAILINSTMYAVYHASGGAQGPLGYPAAERTEAHDTVGRYQTFDGGVIVWHPDTGAASVHGAIHQAYGRVHGSHFGYPLSEQALAPDKKAWVQEFRELATGAEGSIYWTSTHGAHPLAGAIRDAWRSYNGGWSIGYPTTDEMEALPGGRWQRFENADYIWHADTGAHEVHGDIGLAYHAAGGSTWGFPTTDESVAANGGRFNHFRRTDGSEASIYWTPATGAHPVTGPIRERWKELGWEHSHLGYPTGPAVPWAGGGANALEQPFQHGTRMLYRDDLALAGPDPIDLLHDFGKSSQLQGWVRARVFSDTRVEFTGHQRATGENSYSFGIQVAVTDGVTGVAAAWENQVAGTFESGSRNADWNEPGILPSAAMFWDLQRGSLDVKRFKDKSLGWVSGVLESGLKFLVGAGSGAVLGPGGLALAVVGTLATSIATGGNFSGGLRVIGGTLWLFGPAGTLIALGAEGLYQLITDEDKLNDDEWELAREIFGPMLPDRDDLRITDALGANGRPFVFKRFDGKICINMGKTWSKDPMGMKEGEFRNGVDATAGVYVRGEKFAHELVHVWQLEHGSDLLLVLQGMAKVFGEEYDYSPGKDFSDYNLEQQAHLVQDWFARHYTPGVPAEQHGLASAAATNPATDDLWRYIRDNIRSGTGSAL